MDTNLNNNHDDVNERQTDTNEEEKENSQEIEVNTSRSVAQNQPKKWRASSLAIVFALLILTVASVGSYAPIKDYYFSTENNTIDYTESNDFSFALSRFTRYLNESKLQGIDWYDPRYENVESIKYYISNLERDISISNIPEATENRIQQQINNSQFYLWAVFDEEGTPEIETSTGIRFNKGIFAGSLFFSNEEKLNYANSQIIYIVPQDFLEHRDFFTYSMERYHAIPDYLLLIVVIGIATILLLSITAFSLPYDVQRRAAVCRLFNKMFLELKLLFWLGFPMLLFLTGATSHNMGFNEAEAIYHVNRYFYLLGIPATFILYLLIYLTIVYIKYIYYTGFKEGFINNSFMGKSMFYIIRKIKRIIKELIMIDITKSPHKKIFVILAVNLLILWIIALAGGAAFLLAVGYSIFLFQHLVKLMKHLKALNDVSGQLAEGGFDTHFQEDMGMFTPIAENLDNIKEGFQLAVDKEIKSQRMKAELISNVSHDLKTPLTSIITYVDLLKNEEIAVEKQKEYIEILDRKSKRLKVLIEDLFEASRVSSGNVELDLERVDVLALFRQTLGELEEKIADSNLQMRINIPENKIICRLDGKKTYRVFENIMNNIIKYALSNSRVYIDVEEIQGEVSFTFKNISAYEMNFDAAEITERFTRGDASRNTEGSGLGLAIAKSITELQKGSLQISIDGDLFKLIVRFPKEEEEHIKDQRVD
ncbi:Signal transduction histidine kinase [Natronincola peptidivorans]|uniref:histidine kinase n=1 Tax=Natronincola peptidivorans TaxID=426128 RepID=A0A1I0AU02_9FIRM|nr:HAMP domain-containing sensor histidine kinase [Natronincola peptidivorans]SES97668.1 Signal transduction histidine kinase [Natronincola peptidivorans]